MSDPKYNYDHKKKVFEPQLSENRIKYSSVKENAEYKIKVKVDELIGRYKEQSMLDPAKLTDDVKLLQLGVKLPDEELLNLYKKNADNITMQKIINEYAKNNNYEHKIISATTPNIYEKTNAISNINAIANIVIKNHKTPSVYDEFIGENSNLYNWANAEDSE